MNSPSSVSSVRSEGFFFDDSLRRCPGKELCNLRGWTCLCDIERFLKRWQDLGESPFLPRPYSPLPPLNASLPLYVPMIRHGSRRDNVFHSPIVALSTFDVFQNRKKGYGARFSTAEELRKHYHLRPDAQILLVSVAKDRHLETYWSNRNLFKIPDALARLAPLGITVPNYSSFIDAPSSHTKWNLRRMLKNAEEFAATGTAVVPHLNARTRDDWNFWATLLEAQSTIRYVCKEFQTGLHKYEVGARTLWRIDELQHRLGRALHPIMVGGARFAHVAARYFESFTIIDSAPFIKTVKRKRCVRLADAHLIWKKNILPEHASLDELLEYNFNLYDRVMEDRVALAKLIAVEAAQLELPLRFAIH